MYLEYLMILTRIKNNTNFVSVISVVYHNKINLKVIYVLSPYPIDPNPAVAARKNGNIFHMLPLENLSEDIYRVYIYLYVEYISHYS